MGDPRTWAPPPWECPRLARREPSPSPRGTEPLRRAGAPRPGRPCSTPARRRGRKNWLFAGSGAERGCVLYSLLATCKLHGVNPFESLRDVIMRVGNHPARDVLELTPKAWTQKLKDFDAAPAPMIAIQALAGHESPQTTAKYMHLAAGVHAAAVRLFDVA